ncbi:MAG: D-Ala-D-Ala carboxypeptidase family metallohydrolase [Rikenellaceae bacterium]
MGRFFSIIELSHSNYATAKGWNNEPPQQVEQRLKALITQLLDPIRELWQNPIYVNSGYRSPKLNKALGGVATSQHILGEAADITAGSISLNEELFEVILESGLQFDQLICEKGYTWIHISIKEASNRNQVLYL